MLSEKPHERKRIQKEREERALEDVCIKKRVIKYDRSKTVLRGISKKKSKSLEMKKTLEKFEEETHKVATHAARSELVHYLEEPGLIKTEEMERTWKLKQDDIIKSCPIGVSQLYYNLKLTELGPYLVNYSRNGRYLLLGGRKGHIASIDWKSKELICEFQIQETTRDIQYLHNDNMFAIAQKQFVYIYDNTGTELHCVKKMNLVNKLTFLPYHFLLVSASERGVLSYLDVSIGQFVSRHNTGLGPLKTLSYNQYNAVVNIGHHNGTVTLWTPNIGKPVVKMLCHRGDVTGVANDREGRYLVTTGMDSKMRIWDIRQFKPLNTISTYRPAGSIDISQRGLVAIGYNKHCQAWQDVFTNTTSMLPYINHQLPGQLHQLMFCPFEDVLGIGHTEGLSSIIIPGAGEPNLDALEVNPYQTKKQRREWEIKALLEKIPADLIVLNPIDITRIEDKKLTKQTVNKLEDEANNSIRKKVKIRGKITPGKLATKKRLMKERMERIKRREKVRAKQRQIKNNETTKSSSILDRFK